jgi:hypothetical protein
VIISKTNSTNYIDWHKKQSDVIHKICFTKISSIEHKYDELISKIEGNIYKKNCMNKQKIN